jgi:hypothetical protein
MNDKKENPLELDVSAKIAIVGSGPEVLKYELGKKIDEYDEVLRFNKFKIVEFEKYVGTKTTIWSTFGRGNLPIDKHIRPQRIIYVHGHKGNPTYMPQKLWRIPLSHYKKLKKFIAENRTSNTPFTYIPTSGYIVLSWLLEFGCTNIHIIGFDCFAKMESKQHHYWEAKSYKKPHNHDCALEKSIIDKWLLEKKIFKIS